MNRSAIQRTSPEPNDRRQVRLIHALLAFPVAGVIGFTGHTVAKRVVMESPAVIAPAVPEQTIDEYTSPGERGDAPDADDPSAVGAA